MKGTKIVELFIDDSYDEAGIEAISLVSKPAHEEEWMAFNAQTKQSEEIIDEYSPYKIVSDDFCNHHPKLRTLGEPAGELEADGWEVIRVERMTPQMVHKMANEKFSNPSAESELDKETYRIRYKYVGPRDEKNRQFCSDMLSANRVYRIEDIDELTDNLANEEFGFYNIFLWRGSFNCRHVWVRLIYKKEGKIINNANSTRGLEDTQKLGPNLQPDTRNDATKANPGKNSWRPGTPRNGNLFSKSKFDIEPNPCWEGYEPIGLKEDGSPNCVPVKMTADDFAESISDYPEGVKNEAKRAVTYAEKNGWGSCGTAVGKQRASQLAKGEPISVDTIKRMYSYLSRHKGDLKSSKSFDKGCGSLMYSAWGGEAALTWAERKLKSLEKQKMVFSFDEDKRIVVGAAMVPNKMIHRYDDLGNLYYVFFSKESIKKMADKFLKEKRTDETSVEHDGLKLGSDKVFITESWVSEDPVLDKSHFFGFELPSGTWFVAMKVNDDKVWKMIKEKSLTGFSVEGLFAEKSVFSKEDKQINQISKILKSIKDEQ
jgi:hypothetical protein